MRATDHTFSANKRPWGKLKKTWCRDSDDLLANPLRCDLMMHLCRDMGTLLVTDSSLSWGWFDSIFREQKPQHASFLTRLQ